MPAGADVNRIALLVAAGSVLGIAINIARGDRGIAILMPVRSIAEGQTCEAPSAATPLDALAPVDAAGLRTQQGVAFADTRSAAEYAEGHVAGALHLPCSGADRTATESLLRISGARTLILYGSEESDVVPAASALRRRGYKDVRVLTGGWRAWQEAGLPAESGSCDECQKR